ncbi:MAG: hypothetical protein U0556_07205 [Dehalococcoidia bacterium]
MPTHEPPVLAPPDGAIERLQSAVRRDSLALAVGAAAHDLSNLLGIIHGFAEIARSELPPGSTLDQQLRRIEAAAGEAAEVAARLLDLAGQSHPRVVNYCPRTLFENIQRGLAGSASLAAELPPDLPAIAGDPDQIERAILSLALEALETAGAVRLAVSVLAGSGPSEAKQVALDVAGQGWDPDPGGLGVAVARAVAQLHHGSVLLERRPDGALVRLLVPAG